MPNLPQRTLKVLTHIGARAERVGDNEWIIRDQTKTDAAFFNGATIDAQTKFPVVKEQP